MNDDGLAVGFGLVKKKWDVQSKNNLYEFKFKNTFYHTTDKYQLYLTSQK